jgi:arylsulfatase A
MFSPLRLNKAIPWIGWVYLWMGAIFSLQVEASEKRAPNIVLIMADDIGVECFKSYGGESYATPNLDRLAAEGMRFNHCYSQPLCTPSRVKLMTGKSNVWNYSAFSVLNRSESTFAHLLKRAGYSTAVAGKWQLLGAEQYAERFRFKGSTPEDTGFDRYCLWQIRKRGSRYWAPVINTDGILRTYEESDYGPDVFLKYMEQWLEERQSPDSPPFFLYYPMALTHDPFLTTPGSRDSKSKDIQSNFADMVAHMDLIIGRIALKLEKTGLAENTLFLFTTDNGTLPRIHSMQNGKLVQGGKRLSTDAGTHVPLIAWWPGKIAAGAVSDELVDFSDFYPTLAEAAGLNLCEQEELEQRRDGVSFFPQLMGDKSERREWIHIFSQPRPESQKPTQFVRDQRWKLYADGRFYDVASDPLEIQDLAGTTLPDDAMAAKQKLSEALKRYPSQGQRLLSFDE